MPPPTVPRAMRVAPRLHSDFRPGAVRLRHALLINPFYPKDPHASFGKHVLTPTLALTSIAGATPPDWEVAYWDENLLQGPPPCEPFPQVVGITVHLTFAERAYRAGALVSRARRQGRPRRAARPLVSGRVRPARRRARHRRRGAALGARSCATSRRARLQPRLPRRATAGPIATIPPPRRDLLPRGSFLTTTSLIATRGCHNRCGFCYLSTEGLHMPYQMRDVEQVVARVRSGRPAVRRVHRQQPRLAPRLSARTLPRAAARSKRSGAPR